MEVLSWNCISMEISMPSSAVCTTQKYGHQFEIQFENQYENQYESQVRSFVSSKHEYQVVKYTESQM